VETPSRVAIPRRAVLSSIVGEEALPVQPLVDWLIDGAPGALGSDQVVGRMGTWLVDAGVRVARIAAFVRTLHPYIMGRSFHWRLGRPQVEVREQRYAILDTDTHKKSPTGYVTTTGLELRRRLDGTGPLDFPV